MGSRILATFTSDKGTEYPGKSVPGAGANLIECQSIMLGAAASDAAAGASSGQRRPGTIHFRSEFGPSTPVFFNALRSNETIAKAEFGFYPKAGAAADTVVAIQNARVIRISQKSDEPTSGLIRGPRLNEVASTFEVEIAYEGIAITHRKVSPGTPYWLHS